MNLDFEYWRVILLIVVLVAGVYGLIVCVMLGFTAKRTNMLKVARSLTIAGILCGVAAGVAASYLHTYTGPWL